MYKVFKRLVLVDFLYFLFIIIIHQLKNESWKLYLLKVFHTTLI